MSRKKLASTLLAMLLAIAWIGGGRVSSSDDTPATAPVAKAAPDSDYFAAPLQIIDAQRQY